MVRVLSIKGISVRKVILLGTDINYDFNLQRLQCHSFSTLYEISYGQYL